MNRFRMIDPATDGATELRVSRDEIRAALADGFRAGWLPPVREVLVRLYSTTGQEQRARLVGYLLKSVGPLALAVLAAGQFGKYMFRERWSEVTVPLEEASRLSESQFAEIARYVEQADPALIENAVSMLATDGGSAMALGAGAFALLIRFIRERRRTSP